MGNITADINKTVIKGTPLQNSINDRDEYLTIGKSDLLPKANIIPIGKQKIKEKNETIKVNDKPPHAPVSTHTNPGIVKYASSLKNNDKAIYKNGIINKEYNFAFPGIKKTKKRTINDAIKANDISASPPEIRKKIKRNEIIGKKIV
tara:strand:+ start:329 stop:769 length:441 start_codon:yes stop_codon:yes gene_type:complete